MRPYDTLGIPLRNGQPMDVNRIAAMIADWLNERHERGYDLVCVVPNVHATILVVKWSDEDDDSDS